MPAKIPISERIIHVAICQWLSYQESAEWVFHPANGEKRDPRTGRILKALGVKQGVSDLLFIKKSGRWGGFACEVKSEKGKLTENQTNFLNHCGMNGFKIGVVKSLDEFIVFYKDFMAGV